MACPILITNSRTALGVQGLLAALVHMCKLSIFDKVLGLI